MADWRDRASGDHANCAEGAAVLSFVQSDVYRRVIGIAEDSGVISQELLEILVCPACRAKVVLEEEFLSCGGCGRRYPIREGIPVMLIEEGDKHRIEPASGEEGPQR